MNSEVILAALLAQIQKQHDSALERQNEMQVAMAQLLRQVQNEQVRVMEKHLERIHHLDSEIASLKSQIHHDKMPVKKLEDIPKQSVTSFTPSPLKQPQAQPEPARKPTGKAVEPSGDLSASPEFTTAWLIDRVNQLEQEQTSAWKEMLGRFLGVDPPRLKSDSNQPIGKAFFKHAVFAAINDFSDDFKAETQNPLKFRQELRQANARGLKNHAG